MTSCTPNCPRLCTEDGLRTVYERHVDELVAFCRRSLDDHALAEDVVQEVFVRAWRHCGSYRDHAATMRGWLFAIARNAMIDAARARARRPPVLATEIEATQADPRDAVQAMLTRRQLREALDRLSREHRTALLAVFVEDLSYEETAAALGVPLGTVKSRIYYGIRALRTAMAEVDGAVRC
jgi:RNA polymerase sigma-70 factor (ECF subfamily)